MRVQVGCCSEGCSSSGGVVADAVVLVWQPFCCWQYVAHALLVWDGVRRDELGWVDLSSSVIDGMGWRHQLKLRSAKHRCALAVWLACGVPYWLSSLVVLVCHNVCVYLSVIAVSAAGSMLHRVHCMCVLCRMAL